MSSFEVVGAEREPTGEVALILCRAVQERSTNAAKHAEARQVHATLCFGNESAKLGVSDVDPSLSGKAKN